MCFAPHRRTLFRNATSVVQAWRVLYICTSKCASRPNGMHFFDISSSKSGLNLVCVLHFHLEICFRPQGRALFWHLNCQTWSDHGVFCLFWLGNVLHATTACNFSSLIWPAGSARCFSDRTFCPSGPIHHWKNAVGREVPPFSRTGIFLLLIFPLLTLLPSDSSHLCFSTVHIVGSYTGKLPSTIAMWGSSSNIKSFSPQTMVSQQQNFDTEYDMLTTPKPRSA